ncbi:MAG: imidazoleglycerol-phosphate dehydratase [Candidatus Omnitrophota bacterium]
MRKAEIKRRTKETEITVKLDIDGTGDSRIKTSIGFLDHMLELFAFHGLFDLEIVAKGDLNIDRHHTNEDVGIVLGEAFKKALGNKAGIKRFGSSTVPMEEVVASVTVDISGRGSFRLSGGDAAPVFNEEKDYSFKDVEHFLESFAQRLGMNLNIRLEPFNPDLHTTLEPVFKALGIALDMATQVDPRRKGIPSTKGIID